MTEETGELHMYYIGDSDHVVARSVDDAWEVWEETTGCVRGDVFDEPDEAIETEPDDKVLKVWTDDDGEPCEHGQGELTAKTAGEWARQIGRSFAFSEDC